MLAFVGYHDFQCSLKKPCDGLDCKWNKLENVNVNIGKQTKIKYNLKY